MEVIQQAGAVLGVIGLLLLTLWWLRGRGMANMTLGRKTASRRLESLERLTLGPQQTLHLVRLDGSTLLISSSPNGCALIHRSDWRDAARAAELPQ